MDTVHYYTTSIDWKEGRIGTLHAEGGLPDIQVATPPEFPKGVPGYWSPEHLFVASAEICLMTTFLAIADNSKLEFGTYHSSATGKLEKVDGRFMISEITISPRVTVFEEKDIERAERMLQKAEDHCLISHSMKTTVHLKPIVELVTR